MRKNGAQILVVMLWLVFTVSTQSVADDKIKNEKLPVSISILPYTIKDISPDASLLTAESRLAIISALRTWPGTPPVNNTFYLIDVDWRENWAIVTLTSANLEAPAQNNEETPINLSNLVSVLLLRNDTGWTAALDSDPQVQNLLKAIPPSELSQSTRMALFPSPLMLRQTTITAQQVYNNYKFPWPGGNPWRLTWGWHDSSNSDVFPPQTSLDFDIVGLSGSNSDILAAAPGIVTYKCVSAVDDQALIYITTDGTNEKLGYLHLSKSSLKVQNHQHVPQGYVLGRMADLDNGGKGTTPPPHSCALGVNMFTHLHIYFPMKPFTMDGEVFPVDNNQLPWNKDLISHQIPCNPNNAMTRISVAQAGGDANGYSIFPSISGDGRFIAFQSAASNLTDDNNGREDVFVYDRQECKMELVSVSSDGVQGNGDSGAPAISADGRYVSFRSDATNLVNDDSNNVRDIFVHDRQTGQTTRVSVGDGNVQANNPSDWPSISGNGSYIVFESAADNLVLGDTNNSVDIFLADWKVPKITQITSGNGASQTASISSDGCCVAFRSDANNLVTSDTNGQTDVFEWDRQGGLVTLVSLATDNAQAQGYSTGSGSSSTFVSSDGRYVAFSSSASNLDPPDINSNFDVFLRDRVGEQTKMVSRMLNTNVGVGSGSVFSMSGDARYIVFDFASTQLYVYDRLTNRTKPISLAMTKDGSLGNAPSGSPAVSLDGRYVAFYSDANNLVSDDGNGFSDIFVARLPQDLPPTSAPNAAPPQNYFEVTPTLTWSGISWATHYEIQIATDKNFTSGTTHLVNNTLSYTPDALPNGTYYWHIRACSTETKCGTWGPTESFVLNG
jgi:Tol biopolymer transport system component